MSREEKPKGVRSQAMKDRMFQTDRGRALYEILELAGGRISLSRILDIRLTVIGGWCSRNEITMTGAHIIGGNEFFKSKGITRDHARPGMTESDWIAAEGARLVIAPPKDKEEIKARISETEEGAALVKVLRIAGGSLALANSIGVKSSAIHNWIKRGKVSIPGAKLIEATGYFDVTAEQMRPDLTKFQWMDKR